ncbi:MAG: UDP-N-acetylglucosamine 4-epimerase [Acidobacteria bacterium]|nr:UDP-N-acetylglucosamine 4-epimerase [Acidobacteriota bacterium]
MVDANLRAAEAPEAIGQVMNLGIGERVTLNQLLAELQKIIGANLPARYEEFRTGDVRHSLADISRAKELIGYRPLVGLTEGLEQTVTWYRENQ